MSKQKSPLLSIILLWVLTACQAGITAPVKDPSVISISFVTTDYEKKIYEDLARTFEAEHPGIHVEIRSRNQLMTELLATDPQPSVLVQDRWMLSHADTTYAGDINDLITNNLILDLQPLMDGDATFQRNDFYPGTIAQYQTDTRAIWALPRTQYVSLLSYNKDLFTQLAIPLPKPGWSWKDILDIAEQLSRKKQDTVEVYGILKSFATMALITDYFREIGKDLGATPPDQIRFDDPGLEPVIARIQAMRTNGVVLLTRDNDPDNTNLLDIGSPQLAELRHAGKIAMWDESYFASPPNGGSETPDIPPFEIAYTPYPIEQYSFGLQGEAYIISAGTAHPQAAWQWIEFLSRQPGTVATTFGLSSTGRMVPARISTAETSEFWKNTDPTVKEAMLWTVAHMPTEAQRPREEIALGMLLTIDEIVFNHPEMSPQQVLTEVQQQFAASLATQATLPSPILEPITTVATPVPTPDPTGRTTINYYDFGQSYVDTVQLANQFNRSQSRVLVNVVSAVPAGSTAVFEQVAAASDCFLWTGDLPTDADQFVIDLTPYASNDASFARNDYFPVMLNRMTPNGQLLGIPYTVQMRTLHYQSQLFTNANIPPPDATWTLDDMLNAARGLTSGTGDTQIYGYAPVAGFEPDLLFVIEQFGGKLFVNHGGMDEPTLTEPNVVAAIDWYFDLARIHQVMPPLSVVFRPDHDMTPSATIVRSGQAAIWFGESRLMIDTSTINDPMFREAMAPLPSASTGLSASSMRMQSLHISGKSRAPEACWEWLQFLGQDTNVVRWPGILPARLTQTKLPFAVTEIDKLLFEEQSALLQQEERMASTGQRIDSPQLHWFFLAVRNAAAGADLQSELEKAQTLTITYQTCMIEKGDAQTCLQELQVLE